MTFHLNLLFELASQAYESGDSKGFDDAVAKADALAKSSGAGADDPLLIELRVLAALDRAPAGVEALVAPALADGGLPALARGKLIALRGRAALAAGQRAVAVAARAAYRADPRYEQYDECKLHSRVLEAELADDPAGMDLASRELEQLREALRIDGFTTGRWEIEIALARLAVRRGDLASAKAVASATAKQAMAGGFVRIAKAAREVAGP